jgi:hypothetical protein
MAMTQMRLNQAEKDHERVVQDARGRTAQLLGREAKALGSAVARYSLELGHAVKDLELALNASRAALAAEVARESNTTWNDPKEEEKVELGAEVEVAEREAAKLERQRDRKVKAAQERAQTMLEDSSDRLGLKLGDLSPVMDKVKQALKSEVARRVDAGASIGLPAGPTKSDGTHKSVNGTASKLVTAEDRLKAALSDSTSQTEAAQNILDAAMSSATRNVTSGVKEIEESLLDAQKEEIRRVRGTSPAPKSQQRTSPAPKTQRNSSSAFRQQDATRVSTH